jgi:putative peptide zinc metalloprotease protein
MVNQLLPVVRLDGYHILSDLCGVPDLFARIKPTLLRLVPGRKASAEVTALKPWVQVVVTLWVLVVVPLMLITVLFAVVSFPRIVATAWDSTTVQWEGVVKRFGDHEWAGVGVGLIGTGAVLLPVFGTVFMVTRFGRRIGRSTWKAADRLPAGRPLALVAGAALIAGLAFLWWPNGEYRPIQPGERGTVADGLRTISKVPTGRPSLTEERVEELGGAPARADQSTTTTVPAQAPTRSEPATQDEPTTTTTTRRRITTSTTSDPSSQDPGATDGTMP